MCTPKINERMVNRQLTFYLEEHTLLHKHQSGFRAHHSTVTAVLKVMSDILSAVDHGNVACLVFLICRPHSIRSITTFLSDRFTNFFGDHWHCSSLAPFIPQGQNTTGPPESSPSLTSLLACLKDACPSTVTVFPMSQS
jgi:hypothetical protein